jgi:hypothetical protein
VSTFGWVLVAAAVWVGAAVLVGWGLGRALWLRDHEVEELVRYEMDELDRELDLLLGGTL